MAQYQSLEQVHARYCPARNVWGALFFVALCALEAFLCWRGLGEVHEERDIFDRVWDGSWNVVMIAICFRVLMFFRCFQERFVVGVTIAVFVRGLLCMLAPALMNQVAVPIMRSFFVLWIAAFLISLATFVSSA